MKLLLIDDDNSFLLLRGNFCKEKGCIVHTAKNGAQALDFIEKNHYDAIVLDVLLEELSGFDLCRKIKRLTDSPVIFLSNLSDEQWQIKGLQCGGDDYIHKLCGLELFWEKLQKRIHISQQTDSATVIRIPPLEIDLKRRTVTLGGTPIFLTGTEYSILVFIAGAPTKIWSLKDIYAGIWGGILTSQEQVVQVHISRIRAKMEEALPGHGFLETVWGKGYQLVSK